MGKGHHHGGGGWRGGYPPYGYGYGYPWQAPATEVFVVDDGASRDHDRRAMAHIMTLPKAKRAAAYRQIFGREAPAGSLGGFELGQQPAWRLARGQARGSDSVALGIFEEPTLMLPKAGSPEVLGDCGCAGACGSPKCSPVMTAVSGVTDTIAALPTAVKVAGAIGAYFLYKKMKKRRR